MAAEKSIIFGPVPSRRLGSSLGLNTIPPKVCSYSCAYCQLGRTITMQLKRQPFYSPGEIVAAVQEKMTAVQKAGIAIDYLTFVPDGEPTLDIHLETEIDLLRPLGIPIAVITNASLIWQKDVREALSKADWVSLKVDSVESNIWRQIDRPHRQLKLASILEGSVAFAKTFKGILVTETMLLANVNDATQNIGETADFLRLLKPTTAYLSVPTRPPAEQWAQPPDETVLNRAYQIFADKLTHVEYLTGYEGNAFAFTGDTAQDILSITAVHPMRHDALEEFLEKSGEHWEIVQQMVERKQLIETEYRGNKFYLRNFRRYSGNSA